MNGGTITNSNILTFAGTGGTERLYISGTTTLTGGGELKLVDGNSYINDFTGTSTLTNVNNLVHGGGHISVAVTNQSIIRADNGTLTLGATIDNTNGTVAVNNGATLDLGGTTLNGLVNVAAGGFIHNGTLSNAITPGTIAVDSSTLTVKNTITNQGLITFAAAGGTERLYISGATTLTGGGELKLVDGNSYINDFTGTSTLTNVNNLVHGGGGSSA